MQEAMIIVIIGLGIIWGVNDIKNSLKMDV